jgi:plasmid stability protein
MNLFVRDFPDDINRELKVLAARRAVTMREVIIEMLIEGLAKQSAKEGKK